MDILNGKKWHVEQEDCIEHMAKMPAACVDFSVFSPPFPSLYAYTNKPCDIGNSEGWRRRSQVTSVVFLSPTRSHCEAGPRYRRPRHADT